MSTNTLDELRSRQPEEVVVKHKAFGYFEEQPDPLSPEGKPRLIERIVRRGTKLSKDELRAVDWAAGERQGAFYTEEELAPPAELEPGETLEDAQARYAAMSDDELVAWIRGDSGPRPTVSQISGIAGTDPEMARRLLAAENAASGNDPRSSLVKSLEAIANRGGV